jgi:hypothetical protein
MKDLAHFHVEPFNWGPRANYLESQSFAQTTKQVVLT